MPSSSSSSSAGRCPGSQAAVSAASSRHSSTSSPSSSPARPAPGRGSRRRGARSHHRSRSRLILRGRRLILRLGFRLGCDVCGRWERIRDRYRRQVGRCLERRWHLRLFRRRRRRWMRLHSLIRLRRRRRHSLGCRSWRRIGRGGLDDRGHRRQDGGDHGCGVERGHAGERVVHHRQRRSRRIGLRGHTVVAPERPAPAPSRRAPLPRSGVRAPSTTNGASISEIPTSGISETILLAFLCLASVGSRNTS